jgi:tetratricopeptide (TPR) repeat protein
VGGLKTGGTELWNRVLEFLQEKKILILVGGGALLIIASFSVMIISPNSDQPVQTPPQVMPPPQETVAQAEEIATPPQGQTHSVPGVMPPSTRSSRLPRVVETSSPTHSSTLDSYHAAGVELFRDGRYTEAIEAFESDITSSYLFLARCYQILGENEEALKRYQRVLWEYPDRHAFTEVFSLADEMFAAGNYATARKLYYAFIAHVDKMPGPVKRMVPRAYFKVCRCFEQEALNLLEGKGVPAAEDGAFLEGAATAEMPMAPGPGASGDTSWKGSGPYKIHLDTKRVNDFLVLFTVECIGAPARDVLEKLAHETGRLLVIDEGCEKRLQNEMVSGFMHERQIEEILEYLTGQIGMTYRLDEKVLKIESMDRLHQAGWLAMKDEAVKAFRRSLYRFLGHEDAPKVYFEISRLHYLSGDFDSAISPAKTLIAEYPEFSQIPLTLLNISHCHMELGDYKKARQYLSELVNKYTTHPAAQEGYLLLARCWWKEGNPASARLTLRSLEDRFPDSDLRYEGKAILGRILFSQGQYSQVLKLIGPIDIYSVEKEDTAVSLLLLKAEAKLRSNDAAGAVQILVELVRDFPENLRKMDGLYLLAESYLALNQHLMAYATCKNLRENYEASASDPFLYILAGRALKELEFSEEALEWLNSGLERCVEGTGDSYEMYMLLGDILYDLGKYERARVVYRKVREHPVFEKEASRRYVEALMKQKDWEGALEVLVDLLDWMQADPHYRNELFRLAGTCYEELGDMDAAIDAYCGKMPNLGAEQADGS